MKVEDSRLDWTFAYENDPGMPDFVIGGLPPGRVGMLVSAGGTGKTFLSLQIAMTVARPSLYEWPVGDGIFPTPPGAGPVLALFAEETRATLHRRMHDLAHHAAFEFGDNIGAALDAWDERCMVQPLAGMVPTLVDRNGNTTDTYKRLIRAAEGCRLVILDPLSRFHQLDENDNIQMTLLVQHLEGIARATGAAILVCHHANKTSLGTDDAGQQAAARGASALVDGVRYVVNMRTMTRQEARGRWGDEDVNLERKSWVWIEESKVNYGGHGVACWARRDAGGVLVRDEPPAPQKQDGKRVCDV